MQLVEQFEAAARAAAARVDRVPRSADAIAAAVQRLEPGAKRIAIAEPMDVDAELFSACRRLPGAFSGGGKKEFAAADAGLTDVFAGVARTGSVCLDIDHEDAGYVSLLPRAHVAVLDSARIVARPADLFRPDVLGGAGLTRNFVFITGPSATGDMGELVRGAHGPHRIHVLVLV
ncbi:MAG TPA: LUD domain-containing protein [Terriglobales bacterium]|nr:LUD domain-containing protein [Terriglobales bacterium]